MATPDITEEWRPVEGWPYEVSNFGRIRRSSANNGRTRIGKLITLFPKKSGHLRTRLTKDGFTDNVLVHRIVCAAFHGKPPSPIHHAAHIDGNPANNRAENLYWATPKENGQDTVRHGRSRPGEQNNLTKLSDNDALEIRFKTYIFMAELADKYGVDFKTIKRIFNRETFRHLPVNRPPIGAKYPRSS